MATATLQEQVLQLLSQRLGNGDGCVKLLDIVTAVGVPRASVNKELYLLKKLGKVEHVSEVPPVWRLQISRDATTLSGLAAAGTTTCSTGALPAVLPIPSSNLGAMIAAAAPDTSHAGSQHVAGSYSHDVPVAAVIAGAEAEPGSGVEVGAGTRAGAGSHALLLEPLQASSKVTPRSNASAASDRWTDECSSGTDPVLLDGHAPGHYTGSEQHLCQEFQKLTADSPAQTTADRSSTPTAQLAGDAVTRAKILSLLQDARGTPVLTTKVFQQLGITSKEANRILYTLKREGRVTHLEGPPPSWTLSTEKSEFNATLMEPSDNLKKSRNNTLTMPVVNLITESATKVAMIISPTTQGTGFRVGARYLMTAAHVVTEIIAEYSSDAGGGRNLNKEKLCDTSVYAVFDFHETLGQSPNRWFFDNWFWISEEHDVALLKLRADQSSVGSLPGHLGDIIEFSRKPSRHETVILIGHQDTKQKEFDFKGKACVPDFVSLDKQLFQEAAAKRSDLIFYRTRLEHGSSGAPIFMSRGDSLFLVGIHLRSYPSREAVADQAKRGERVRQFQAGTSMAAIRQCLAKTYGEDCVADMLGLKAAGSSGAGLSPPGAY